MVCPSSEGYAKKMRNIVPKNRKQTILISEEGMENGRQFEE